MPDHERPSHVQVCLINVAIMRYVLNGIHTDVSEALHVLLAEQVAMNARPALMPPSTP